LILLLIFSRRKLLRFPDKQLTSLAGSFIYVSPEVIKITGHGNPVDIWWTGITSKDELQAHFSLCTAIITYVPLCGEPPLS